jgi:hypothetical protein
VQASLDDFVQRARSCSPAEFSSAYLNFVIQVQGHLGETGEAPIVF